MGTAKSAFEDLGLISTVFLTCVIAILAFVIFKLYRRLEEMSNDLDNINNKIAQNQNRNQTPKIDEINDDEIERQIYELQKEMHKEPPEIKKELPEIKKEVPQIKKEPSEFKKQINEKTPRIEEESVYHDADEKVGEADTPLNKNLAVIDED